MSLKIYNTLSKKVEDFTPIREGEVRLYACGPTVYNYAHIGNFRAYLFSDLLRRFLKYLGLNVKHVMNITDIDDKTIRDSRKEGKPLREFTDFYLKEFLSDMDTLGIERPEVMPRATDEIPSMVEMICVLLEKGHAYKTDRGDVYFKIDTFPTYGELINLDTTKLKENADGRLASADEYDKDNANDFALWKAHHPDDGDVYWETELGKGRPGWHIECSAMANTYLEAPFDIHIGGIDLMFPHHTNEIAQAECCLDKKFVHYWMHNEHLLVNGQKMSKSLGNFYTLRDLLDKGYHPLAIRLELLKTHYRARADFREDNVRENIKILEKFEDFSKRLESASATSRWQGLAEILKNYDLRFKQALCNDLNISEALATLHSFVSEVNKNIDKIHSDDAILIKELAESFDSVVGIMNYKSDTDIAAEVEELISARQEARKNKDYARADEIRDQLLSMNIELKDTADGVTWKRVTR